MTCMQHMQMQNNIMMENEEYIRKLADKYMDGLTTAAEERQLARLLDDAGGSLPADLRACRAMFAYVAAGRARATDHRRHHSRLRLAAWVGAAAAAAATVVAVVVLTSPPTPQSYAVIDGRVVTDPDVVRREAVRALRIVASDDYDTFGALDMMRAAPCAPVGTDGEQQQR